jgi:hypothetical protein
MVDSQVLDFEVGRLGFQVKRHGKLAANTGTDPDFTGKHVTDQQR